MQIYYKTYITTDTLNVDHFLAKLKGSSHLKPIFAHLTRCNNEYSIQKIHESSAEVSKYIAQYLNKHGVSV